MSVAVVRPPTLQASELETSMLNMLVSTPLAASTMALPMAPANVPSAVVSRPTVVSIGCAMNGVTPTVLVMRPQSVRNQCVAAASRIALKNGNRLHIVLVGNTAAQEEAAQEAAAEEVALGTLGAKAVDIHALSEKRLGALEGILGADVAAELLGVLTKSFFIGDNGGSGGRVTWLAFSQCGSTRAALEKLASLRINKSVPMDDLQYDVNCTLSSLVQASELTDGMQSAFPWTDVGTLQGRIGSIVRLKMEAFRITFWTRLGAPDVVMLLPEAWIRFVLQDLSIDSKHSKDRAAYGCVFGSLVDLSAAEVITFRRPDLTEAEQLCEQVLGPRLWRLDHGSVSRHSAYSAQGIVFETLSLSDPFYGVQVKWVFAPGEAMNQPTLDTVF